MQLPAQDQLAAGKAFRQFNLAFVALDQQVLEFQLCLDAMFHQFQRAQISVFWMSEVQSVLRQINISRRR